MFDKVRGGGIIVLKYYKETNMKPKTKIIILSIALILLINIFIKEVDASNLIDFDNVKTIINKDITNNKNVEKSKDIKDTFAIINIPDANLKSTLNENYFKKPADADIT